MGAVLRLVDPVVSRETVRCFEYYEQLAKDGGAVGAVMVVFKPGGGYLLDAVGAAKDDIPRTRGLLLELHEELSNLRK